jgi:cbb3-type cytochrome oxidase maturation protein
MSIIYILIPIAILLTVLGIYLFFWAVKTEQFDDLEKQGMSILFDENKEEENSRSHNKENQGSDLPESNDECASK